MVQEEEEEENVPISCMEAKLAAVSLSLFCPKLRDNSSMFYPFFCNVYFEVCLNIISSLSLFEAEMLVVEGLFVFQMLG